MRTRWVWTTRPLSQAAGIALRLVENNLRRAASRSEQGKHGGHLVRHAAPLAFPVPYWL